MMIWSTPYEISRKRGYNGANEYGNASMMVIYGVEIINEGSGFSADTNVTEKAYTYMARRIESMKSIGEGESFSFASSW